MEGFERGHVAVGDATSIEDMRQTAEVAAHVMGGIDMMLYAAGFGVLQSMADTDPETWLAVYSTNVIGANLATSAALPHIERDGVLAYLSSRTTGDVKALFGSYSASKAALDQCISTWRVEEPGRRFVRLVMGNTQPTEFADHRGLELVQDVLESWDRQSIRGGMMDVDEVAHLLAHSVAGMLDHPGVEQHDLTFDARI